MNEAITEFLTPTGPTASSTPLISRIFNIALAAATNTATDLSGANFTGLATAIAKGSVVTLTPSVDTWYRWATATGTVDKATTAASTPANQGVFIGGGCRVSERPPPGCTWLICTTDVLAGVMCVQIASISENAYLAGGFGS